VPSRGPWTGSIFKESHILGPFLDLIKVFLTVQFAVYLVVSFLTCWVVTDCYRKIPQEHHAMAPRLVWLLMIPVFNIVWNFWVFPKLSKSFRSYFDSVQDATVGDCAARIAHWVCLCGALSLFPPLVPLAAPAFLILLIVYLLRTMDLRGKIKAG